MRVASAQTSPIWLNKTATSLRVIDWLERAAKAQVDLVVFPEAFLSGYPFWVSRTNGARFEEPRQKQAYAMYLEEAVELDGPSCGRSPRLLQTLASSPTWVSPNEVPAPGGEPCSAHWRPSIPLAGWLAPIASWYLRTTNVWFGGGVMPKGCVCIR